MFWHNLMIVAMYVVGFLSIPAAFASLLEVPEEPAYLWLFGGGLLVGIVCVAGIITMGAY
jgi:hypothetical protein